MSVRRGGHQIGAFDLLERAAPGNAVRFAVGDKFLVIDIPSPGPKLESTAIECRTECDLVHVERLVTVSQLAVSSIGKLHIRLVVISKAQRARELIDREIVVKTGKV